MRDWKEIKLCEVAEVKYGKAHQSLADGNVPAYGSGGLMRFVEKALYAEESILIPRKGSLNNVLYKNEPFWTVDTMFYTKLDKKIIFPKFLFYQLITVDFANMNVGSAVPSMTVQVLNEIDIKLPPLPEQQSIAEILSSLDDKIDLLHRQNKTLEQLAETLFRQWFVEDAEKSWEVDILGNIIELQRGISYSGSTLGEFGNGVPMHNLNSIDVNGSYKYDGIKYYKGEIKGNKKLKSGDLLIINTDITQDNRIIGWPIFVPEKFPESVCTHHLYSTSLLTNKISKLYLYFLLRFRDYREALANAANGTTVSMLSKDTINNLEIKIPPKTKIAEFEEIVKGILEKQTLNQKQISSTTKLRDTLLPKLMSGIASIED
jgi:type I restriction enzyme S subunit